MAFGMYYITIKIEVMLMIFDINELNWIKEVVEDKVLELKEKGYWNIYEYDKKVLTSILNKIEVFENVSLTQEE